MQLLVEQTIYNKRFTTSDLAHQTNDLQQTIY